MGRSEKVDRDRNNQPADGPRRPSKMVKEVEVTTKASAKMPQAPRKRWAVAATGNSGGNTANLKPWRPGQSGNPRGRPAVPPEVRELARAHTVTAVNTLVAVMTDEKATAAARVSAANALLDRAHGRPLTEVDVRSGGLTGAPPVGVAAIDVSKLTAEQIYAYVINGADLPAIGK